MSKRSAAKVSHQVFAELDETPRGKTCDAIVGIIEEGQEVMKVRLWMLACSRRHKP